MIFLIVPMVIAALGIAALNIKIGFIVADITEETGFDVGFYLMTVFGLFALEGCTIAELVNTFS